MTNSDNTRIAGFVREFSAKHGYPPSQIEIARHFGLSPSGVRRRLVKAADDGAISWDPSKRRSIRTTDMKHRGVETL